MAPDQPRVDRRRFDPRAEGRAADEPQTVAHSVEPRVVSRQILPVDRRLGLQHAIDRDDHSRQKLAAFGFAERGVQPVPGQHGMDPRRGIPVDRFSLVVTLLVERRTGLEAAFRQVEITRVLGHPVDEGRGSGFRPQVLRFRLAAGGGLRQQAIDADLDAAIPVVFGAQRPLFHGRPGLSVEEQPRMVWPDLRGPLRQRLVGGDQWCADDREADSQARKTCGRHGRTPGFEVASYSTSRGPCFHRDRHGKLTAAIDAAACDK